MSDEEFEETEEVDDEIDEELLLDDEEELDPDLEDLDELDEVEAEVEAGVDDVVEIPVPVRAPRAADEVVEAGESDDDDDDDDDVVLDLEDEEDTTDVEDPLDVLLRERIASDLEDDDDLDDDDDDDDRSDGGSRIPAKRPGEFVCKSCFLVKAPSQMADPAKQYCRDCV